MGDVAQILGSASSGMKLLSGSQDTNSASLPPIVPTFVDETTTPEKKETSVKVGNKWISSGKPARPWTWAPFVSSSRTDGHVLSHWQRAGIQFIDYPYAKFDIHLDPVTYTDEEYARYLKNENWTRSETDKLMEVARKYELRWAVIHDRWIDYCHSEQRNLTSLRKVEDLQHRYYTVASILSQNRFAHEAAQEAQELSEAAQQAPADMTKERAETLILETAAAKSLASGKPKNQPLVLNLGSGSTNKTFDLAQERDRRARLDDLWNRSKEEEVEEMELRKELRLIEAQLRKLKKTGGHLLASANASQGAAASKLSSAASSRNPSRSVSPVPGSNIAEAPPALLDQCFASSAPVPMARTPYLQSGRLLPPATGGAVGLNKTLLNRMDAVLTELKIPSKPIPTKRVCDLYDSVRKDILTLLTLQKLSLQKAGNLQAKRLKLAKVSGGGRVMDEEALLGISSAPANTSSAVGASTSRGKGARTTKAKATTPTGKTKVAPASGSSKPKIEDTGKKAKTTTKRKRKSESKSPAPPQSDVADTAPSSLTPVPLPKLSTEAAKVNVDAKQSGGGGKKRVRKS